MTYEPTKTVPLSKHPLWETKIAGTPDAPLHGAIFTEGVFTGWKEGSIFEGIDSYLEASLTESE